MVVAPDADSESEVTAAQKLCSISGCGRPGNGGRGWCKSHYGKYRRHGDPQHGEIDVYRRFLEAKAPIPDEHGRTLTPGEIHPALFPHQRAIVEWAVRGGQRAIFAAFGLGKSVMQLETLRLVTPDGERALIVCPLGVRTEFLHDAAMLDTGARFVRRTEEVDEPGIYITNYESVRDGRLDVNLFTAVSLDEASVLRSYGSKTYQTFLSLFEDVEFRFVATATPSPNRFKELIHYAGFLGVMDTGQALTRFFQRNSEKAGDLTLYAHKEEEFWLWLSSWAVFLQKPSDLGFDDDGYDLPPLDVQYHEVNTGRLGALEWDRDGQAAITIEHDLGVEQAAAEKRQTLPARIEAMAGLVRDLQSEPVVIWCDLNDEQKAIEGALDDLGVSFSSVHGSLNPDESERRIEAWKRGETQALVGKPVMLGQGMNLQRASRAVFVGLTFKFNDTIQAVHRIWRFGQTRPCVAHIIHADTERSVVGVINEKWHRHRELTSVMSNLIREHGLNDVGQTEQLLRSIGVERVEASGDRWVFANNDCVEETRTMDTDSVALIATSIPFSNHYEYTPSYNDFGHTDSNDHFWSQMDFLTPELLRILEPGRIYACHVKDRIDFGSVTGAGVPTSSPFHAEAIFHAKRHGFDYLGMITVVTDVVRENNQTYRLGWSENSKDSSKMGVGSPEYVLLFRKPQTDRSKGYADVPVTKAKEQYSRARWQVDAHGYWRSGGDRLVRPEEWASLDIKTIQHLWDDLQMSAVHDHELQVSLGETIDTLSARGLPSTFMLLDPKSWHPDVWTDVNRMLTLNSEQSRRRLQMHVCPLQFDIVDRLIERYSMPDELVFDPFGGLGTVPLRAIEAGRRGRGVELNPGYYLDAIRYLSDAESAQQVPTLFDLLEGEAA